MTTTARAKDGGIGSKWKAFVGIKLEVGVVVGPIPE